VNTVALSPDEKTIASGGVDRVFRLWNAETRELVFTSPEQELPLTSISFSPDGELLATSTGNWQKWQQPGEVKLWKAASGEELASLEGHATQVNVAVFSPDGRRLATGTGDSLLHIWDVATRTQVVAANTGAGVRHIAWFPDGQRLALAQYPVGVVVWNLATSKKEAVFAGHDKLVNRVAVSSDGEKIISIGNDGAAKIWAVPGR
jgi:WD40 repeat protein